MRRVSREKTGGKPESIMDVNARTVIERMTTHGTTRLIHGHTHRPAVHDLVIDGRPAQRIVLGDWYEHGSLLECSPNGCELLVLDPPQVSYSTD
jgi:UDP-2,3-diacylglucosamine hydrolase